MPGNNSNHVWNSTTEKWVQEPYTGTTASDGSAAGSVVVVSAPTRDEIDANANGYTYYGTAPYGSNKTSDLVWTIERKSADGNEFMVSAPNQDWADRLTIDYNNGVA